MFLYAINAIDRGSNANPRHIKPGHVIELDMDKTVAMLLDISAMREATAEEVKIAQALGRFYGEPVEIAGPADRKKRVVEESVKPLV